MDGNEGGGGGGVITSEGDKKLSAYLRITVARAIWAVLLLFSPLASRAGNT